jgi:hypothetical protein
MGDRGVTEDDLHPGEAWRGEPGGFCEGGAGEEALVKEIEVAGDGEAGFPDVAECCGGTAKEKRAGPLFGAAAGVNGAGGISHPRSR